MTITLNGRIGIVMLCVLGIIVGVGLVVGFALPAILTGVWLGVGSFLALIGA